MPLTYSNAQHRLYLDFMERNAMRWLALFDGNTDFYSAAYWDLLRGMWRADAPVRKTDALAFMGAVKSPHTAGKYIEAALGRGYLQEHDNPEDARSKLLTLAPEMRAKLDAFFDFVVGGLVEVASEIDAGT